ncbi:MAG TPA: TolC family protein [Caulobacteraceae bacterium]|jgi:NodT family efflux transporter outer membrane factor (OMF) lipoprotein|nr:TolC family protein [Caulobacteraceae bacterium]
MRRLRHLVLVTAFGAGLTACATTAPTPRIVMPTAYDGAGAGSALTAAQLDRWWLLFKDAQLDALEDEAFAHSPDARTAEARVLEARATRNASIDETLPTGQIQANASRQRSYNIGAASNSLFPVGGTTDTEQAIFNVSWELDLFGRLAQKRAIAKANFAAARFDIEGSRASLAAGVADNYFQARGLAIQLADAEESARIEGELQSIAAQKATIGIGAATDADRVAGDLAQAQAQVQTIQGELHAAERQLLILVGRPFDPTAKAPIEASVYDPPPAPAALPGSLLARRPDVRESEAQFRAEAGTAHIAHLAIFPTFTLLPGLGATNITQPGVAFIPPTTLIPQQQTTSLGFWSLGAGATVPVLDIPRLLSEAKAEDARTQQAAIKYEKTVQTAYGEAENALVALEAAERGAAILAAGEVRAHKASEAARRLYGMGLNDITAALSAEQAWRTTRSALTSARVQALRQAVTTYKALGGGWAYSLSDARTR